MLSRKPYRLTWVSLTLDMGYLLTAAPAKHSHCSLNLTSSPLLTLNVEQQHELSISYIFVEMRHWYLPHSIVIFFFLLLWLPQ